MNEALWKKIQDFELDYPLSEYGFTTRLINENFWTTNFAQAAITEYKKFMYLAAISPVMVSPSQIVDTVWHQHLVFTESYDNLCEILGKKIAHIPSTHNKEDFSNFKQAKERTQKLYLEYFGAQPIEFWEKGTIYDSLSLPKAKISVPTIIIIGILAFLPLTLGAYLSLKQLYVTIDNPYFIIGYGLIQILFFFLLEFYNRKTFSSLVDSLDKSTFIFNLSALELLYLQNNNLSKVIHGLVNELIRTGKILISPGNQLIIDDLSRNTTDSKSDNSDLESCVLEAIRENKNMDYPDLIKKLRNKPAFNKIARTINSFKNYLGKSVFFTQLFAINFTVLAVGLSLGAVRLLTGFFREKPVTIIIIILVSYLTIAIAYLIRLKSLIGMVTLPKYYEENIVQEKLKQNLWDWNYYYMGPAVFITAFLPLISSADRGNENSVWFGDSGSSIDSGSSGDSSCGSSGCGSSCGGCGGGSD